MADEFRVRPLSRCLHVPSACCHSLHTVEEFGAQLQTSRPKSKANANCVRLCKLSRLIVWRRHSSGEWWLCLCPAGPESGVVWFRQGEFGTPTKCWLNKCAFLIVGCLGRLVFVDECLISSLLIDLLDVRKKMVASDY